MFDLVDPRAVKLAMRKLGIKQNEIEATRVVIETPQKNIIIENPSVSKIDMQGNISFQISGTIHEKEKEVEISEDDIKLVMEKTSASREEVVEKLKENKGDIAKTILELKK